MNVIFQKCFSILKLVVCISISINQSINVSIHLSIYLSIYQSVNQSIYLGWDWICEGSYWSQSITSLHSSNRDQYNTFLYCSLQSYRSLPLFLISLLQVIVLPTIAVAINFALLSDSKKISLSFRCVNYCCRNSWKSDRYIMSIQKKAMKHLYIKIKQRD